MKEINCKQEAVLVAGSDKLAFSVTTCLLQGGYNVTLYTQCPDKALACIKKHFSDLTELPLVSFNWEDLNVVDKLQKGTDYCFAILVTAESLEIKKELIGELENILSPGKIIAVNTESLLLEDLQKETIQPGRIIGANWVEPAHNTQFLELICTDRNDKADIESFSEMAKNYLQKDPYTVKNLSIRAKLMGAMTREANYLIENDYASVEDIDRACRNDAGYYLPFAGNFRYMDLMGTNAYGMVMSDLNPELAKDSEVPSFFKKIIENGSLGMENNKGFYNYKEGDNEKWDKVFRKFSYQIQNIINKYPFNYTEDNGSDKK